MEKYDPLGRYLRRQRTAHCETFGHIERLLGALLPNCSSRPEWWANEQTPSPSNAQCRAWLDAGYKAFLVKGADKVRFERL